MRGTPVAVAILALSICGLPEKAALAQGASSQAAAQALFEQSRQLMADGKFSEACPKLAESERLDPGAGTLLNLGHCYEKNGQTASAWVTFKDAAAAADLKHRADWSARARERAKALEPTLSKLTIDVPPEARLSGLQVRRDGVEVGSVEWGTPIPTDPGPHTIEAAAAAKKPWTTTTTVGPKADQARVAVPVLEDEVAPTPVAAVAPPSPASPPAAVPPSTSAPPPEASPGSTQKTVGLVVGGVGIAGIAVGAIFGALAAGNESNSKTLCPALTCSNATGVQDNSNASSQATISTVGIIAGGVLVAGGLVLFLTAPKAHPTTALRLTPTFGPGAAGAQLGGAW